MLHPAYFFSSGKNLHKNSAGLNAVPFKYCALPLHVVGRCNRLSRYSEEGRGGVLRNFVSGGSTNSVEDRGQRTGIGGGSTLVRVSGGSCNLVQEISFHLVKFP